MKSAKVDGQDVEAVYKAARKALEQRAAARVPSFSRSRRTASSAITSAIHRSTAPRRSSRNERDADPLDHLRAKLELSDEEVEEIDREVQEIVEASVEFAKNGTDPKPEDALKNVYA